MWPRSTTAGVIPAIFSKGDVVKELSIFVDESGDFGKFNEKSPYYIVSFVFHEQQNSIKDQVLQLDHSITEIGFKNHTIHTAPLVRKEQSYKDVDISIRRKLFYKLFCFTKNIEISYASLVVHKHPQSTQLEITRQLSKQIAALIRDNFEYFAGFDNIIIYYDNGQYQLTQILVAVFNTLLSNDCDFRQVLPKDYKLFQTADLICTLTLIKNKLEQGKHFTKSEEIFFGSPGKIRKTFLKYLDKIFIGNVKVKHKVKR